MGITKEKSKIHFNIGVAGFLDKERDITVYQQKITETLEQIKERVHFNEQKMYSICPEDVSVDLYTSPHIADELWCGIYHAWNQGNLQIVLSEDDALTSENKFISATNIYKTTIANSLKDIAKVNTMIDWVTSQIDIAILLWDGSENAQNGHIWNFIEHCKKAGLPCIWLNSTDCGKRSWFQDIYPVPFNEQVLWDYIDGFYVNDDPAKQLAACRVRHLIRMRAPVNQNIDSFVCWNMLEHLKEFFESQIRYQETGRVRRFEGIKNSIHKWSGRFLKITLVFLFSRGIIQVFLGVFKTFLYAKLHSFISSLANMIALLITAVYDLIVRQDGINRYSGYYNIADKILSVLRVYEERLRKIRSDYQQNENHISYERIYSLTNDVIESLINELYMWCNETTPRG